MCLSAATKDQLAAIHQLECAVFGHHAYPLFFFRQAFDCWPQGLIVAKHNDHIQGYALVATCEKSGEYTLLSLAIAPEHQGQGIGKALLKKVLNMLSKGEQISLTVDPNNTAAVRLYASLGFSVQKEEANYFGDGESRLVMQKHI